MQINATFPWKSCRRWELQRAWRGGRLFRAAPVKRNIAGSILFIIMVIIIYIIIKFTIINFTIICKPMRHRVHTDPSLKQEYSPHVSRLSAEPHRKFILTLTHTLLTLRTLMWLFIRVGKSNLDFHCSSWPRVYWTRLGKSWCADRAVRTGSVIWPWICHASLASYFAAFTLWHHHVAVTPITQPVSEIHVLSWTDLECKREIKNKSKKGPSWGQKWPMWSMWFSPRMARQLTERCLEVRISALAYARLAGLLSHTEVNDAHLVAAHSYLTAPVTLPPPLRTCCVRLRARLPHMVVRALTCVAFQRNSPTAGRYVPLTFPSSLSAIVSRRLSILFQVHCQKFFALLAPMDLLHLCKNISATLCKYFSSCHLPTFSFAFSSWWFWHDSIYEDLCHVWTNLFGNILI